MARRKTIACDRILDAAEQVVLKHGASHLTLDLVAAEASISKGGLTYTFNSKDALLKALLDRETVRVRALQREFAQSPKNAPYPELRYMLVASRDRSRTTRRRVAPLLAALLHAPELLQSIRQFLQEMLATFPSDTEADRRARTAFFASQGQFLLEGFGLIKLKTRDHNHLIVDLLRLIPSTPRATPSRRRAMRPLARERF